MRRQYHPRRTADGLHVWDVHRLVRLARELEPAPVPLSEIAELDEDWWYAESAAAPTPRSLAEHMRLALDVDPSHPVILSADGRLMDGMHRVVRALVEGRDSVLAVRFPATPAPDYLDVPLNALPHDDGDP